MRWKQTVGSPRFSRTPYLFIILGLGLLMFVLSGCKIVLAASIPTRIPTAALNLGIERGDGNFIPPTWTPTPLTPSPTPSPHTPLPENPATQTPLPIPTNTPVTPSPTPSDTPTPSVTPSATPDVRPINQYVYDEVIPRKPSPDHRVIMAGEYIGSRRIARNRLLWIALSINWCACTLNGWYSSTIIVT